MIQRTGRSRGRGDPEDGVTQRTGLSRGRGDPENGVIQRTGKRAPRAGCTGTSLVHSLLGAQLVSRRRWENKSYHETGANDIPLLRQAGETELAIGPATHICVCVCVCARARARLSEREREADLGGEVGQTEKQGGGGGGGGDCEFLRRGRGRRH